MVYPDTELEQLNQELLPGVLPSSPCSYFLSFSDPTSLRWVPRGWGQLASACQMEVAGSRESFEPLQEY